MRIRSLVAAAMLLPLAASPAAGQINFGCARPARLSSPFAFVSVNGQCTDLSGLIVPATKGWTLNAHVMVAGSTIDLSVLFNPDPSLTFKGTTGNPSPDATTYGFILGTPINPDVYSLATSSVGFSVTSAGGTTTVSNNPAQPVYLTGYGSSGATLTNLGVDDGKNSCVASGAGAETTCATEGRTNSFAPAFYDNLEAFLTYRQDNQLSTATYNGSIALERADAVTVTPEPSALALFATGLLLIAGYAVRRRRSAGA